MGLGGREVGLCGGSRVRIRPIICSDADTDGLGRRGSGMLLDGRGPMWTTALVAGESTLVDAGFETVAGGSDSI